MDSRRHLPDSNMIWERFTWTRCKCPLTATGA